jgi:hypothetical protein
VPKSRRDSRPSDPEEACGGRSWTLGESISREKRRRILIFENIEARTARANDSRRSEVGQVPPDRGLWRDSLWRLVVVET